MVIKKLESKTEQGVRDLVEQYERRYHPIGYGTRCLRVEQRDDGWVAIMNRYDHCD